MIAAPGREPHRLKWRQVINRTAVWSFSSSFRSSPASSAGSIVLAHDSRLVAEEESSRQNTLLLKEIAAHKKTDAALQYAKETAEAANRAKSRYVVGLSHELRTPLNAVLGYAQILERDETIPAPRQSAIKVIKRSADHLSGLIDGLLDISKIEAGRLQVYSNEINIQDFLDQIADMFRPQAQAKGLVFDHVRAQSLPQFVRTDEKRLRQILVNLLSNAIKFTRYRHHPLRRRLSQPGGHLHRIRYRAAASRRPTCRASSSPSSAARPSISGPCRGSASD